MTPILESYGKVMIFTLDSYYLHNIILLWPSVCLTVCLSQASVLSKQLNRLDPFSHFDRNGQMGLSWSLAQRLPRLIFHFRREFGYLQK